MSEDTKEISEQGLAEVVVNIEQITDLARNFQWVSPERNQLGEHKTNLEVIEESMEMLADLGMIDDTKKELEWLKRIRSAANGIYKDIYPLGQRREEEILEAPYYHGIEPFYHGIGTEEDWTGHNDYVMATTARVLSGLIRFKKEGDEVQKAELDEFLGKGWQDIELTAADLRSLMAMAAFHEVGEWWIKGFWQKAIAKQREQFDQQREEGKPIEEIKVDPILRDIVRALPVEERDPGIVNMNRIIAKMKPIIEPLGLAIDYNDEREASEFTLFFEDGKTEDVSFIPKSRLPKKTIATKASLKADIFKISDFFQCLCPNYREEVTYIPEGEEMEKSKKFKGSLALYVDFYSFKPGALPSAGWKEPRDVNMDDYFYNELLVPYAKNEYVFKILDWTLGKEKNDYRQAAADLDRKRNKMKLNLR